MRNQLIKEVTKIELISFKNPKKFANVAYLLDRKDFIAEMLQFRKKLQQQTGIQLPLQWEIGTQWDKQLWKPLLVREQNRRNRKIEKAFKAYLVATVDDSLTERIKMVLEQALRGNVSEAFLLDIKELRKKYHQSVLMEKVIAKAIIYNEVHEEDYTGCYINLQYPYSENLIYFDEPQLVVIMDASTKADDLKQVHDDQFYRKLKEYKLAGMTPKYDAVGEKEKPKIIVHREWYWLSVRGFSYGEILKSCPVILKEANYSKDKIGSTHNKKDADAACIYCQTIAGYDAVGNAVKEYPKWLNL